MADDNSSFPSGTYAPLFPRLNLGNDPRLTHETPAPDPDAKAQAVADYQANILRKAAINAEKNRG